MPEGPEVRVIAQAFNDAIGRTVIHAGHTKNEKYKWARDGIPGWDKVQGKPWKIENVEVKGKLIRVNFSYLDQKLSMLSTLGLEGYWSWGDSKHARVWFNFSERKLTYHDSRNFGTIRFMSSEEADKKMTKIGHDLLASPMDQEAWKKLQGKPSVASKAIGEVLMNQKLFSGIGNIYKAEVLYNLKINPSKIVGSLKPETWAQVNHEAHKVLKESYQKKGSSVKSYNGGSFQRYLNVYKQKTCPQGHDINSVTQNKRTTWYCKVCQA